MNNSKNVFIIMPFSNTATCTESQWTEIYENVFRPAVEDSGFVCERAMSETGSLIKSIVAKLRYSRIVLADITDRNPNVFYELGVRHSLSKRTIIVTQNGEHVPSDLRGYWFITYGTSPGQVKQFREKMGKLIEVIESDPDKSDNPVSDYLEQENANISNYINTENIKKLSALYTECTGNIITLSQVSKSPTSSKLVLSDCLRLLLQTMYIDLGPELLSRLYELHNDLKVIELGFLSKEIIETTIDDLNILSEEILNVRNRLASGEYKEPANVSLMVWEPTPAPPENEIKSSLLYSSTENVVSYPPQYEMIDNSVDARSHVLVCRGCNGTGQCSRCKGSGREGEVLPCAKCGGSGNCTVCKGKGRA